MATAPSSNLWRVLIPLAGLLLVLPAVSIAADDLTEQCLEYGSVQQADPGSADLVNAISRCNAAVEAHPDSNTLNALLARLLIRDNRALAAVPYIETLLADDYSADTADLVHETCAQLAGTALAEQSVESLLASDGSFVPGQDTVTVCGLSAELELFDPTLGAKARYWGGLTALTRTEADRGCDFDFGDGRSPSAMLQTNIFSTGADTVTGRPTRKGSRDTDAWSANLSDRACLWPTTSLDLSKSAAA